MFESVPEQREKIKAGLDKCLPDERVMFCRMYGPKIYSTTSFIHNIDALAEHNINEVVDAMPARQLVLAQRQINSTVRKHE